MTPIGVVRSEHKVPGNTPIQPVYAQECLGRAELFPEYVEGLESLGGFSHVMLLYHFHLAGPAQLTVQPFTDDAPRGVFATRHPRRPNRLGLSIVRLVRIEGNVLHVAGVDIVDGAPLLDIKPYVPRFDLITEACGGWTESVSDSISRERGRRGFQGRKSS